MISVHGVYGQVLFNDTILHNIAYGRPSATQEQVIQAAKQAVIAAFMLCFKSIFRLIVCVPVEVLEHDVVQKFSSDLCFPPVFVQQRLHDAVLRMPDGYATRVGERGLKVRVPFGQKNIKGIMSLFKIILLYIYLESNNQCRWLFDSLLRTSGSGFSNIWKSKNLQFQFFF